jgi:tRNA(Ile)-lysidine synthase
MLVAEISRAVRELRLQGCHVLVAVSGGIDSTALVHALRDLVEGEALKLSIGHVNHGLRGAESEADEAAVRALGTALGLRVHVAAADPKPLRVGRSSRDRPTLQEAARQVRYAALARLAEDAGAGRIATAHTADDQAETVLLRLLRGTGPDGLGAIPEQSPDGRIVRPLLRVSRAEVETFARERGLTWREDATNARLDYTRNRLRHRWLPGLVAEFNPQLLRAVGDLAEAQRRDSEWIATLVEREAASRISVEAPWLRIETKDWEALPEALARRLIRWALRRCGAGRSVSRVHLVRALAFARSSRVGARIELPGGIRLWRERDGVRMGPIDDAPAPAGRHPGAC